MKRLPNSITAMIALTIVIAMVLGFSLQHLVSSGLAHLGLATRETTMPRWKERLLLQLPGRVAGLIDILNAVPPDQRAAIVAAAQRPPMRIRLLDAPATNLVDHGEPDAALLRRQIEAALSFSRPVIVVDRYRLADVEAGPTGGRVENGVAIEAALSDGHWLVLETNLEPPNPTDPIFAEFSLVRIAAWLALSVGLATSLSILAARRVVRPLSDLANAVDRLGASGDDPPIPPRGPREVESTINAFNRMRERLRRFNEDRTRMIAAMSHDLRTPLTRLRMRIEMAEGIEDQQKMLDELDHMSGLIESILSFARDDAKQEPRSLVDLSALVEGICENASDAGALVTFSGPRDVTISCRPTALRRAVSNLVDNAIKYGGSAAVSLASEAGQVVLVVEDEGPGIPKDERERVFEPFYRLDSSRNPETGGVGLGLSVTRSIIWEHGGEITLGNRKGGGLSVRVALPIGTQGRSGAGSAEPGAQI